MVHTQTKIIAVLSTLFFIGSVLAASVFIQRVSGQKKAYTEIVTAQEVMHAREASLGALAKALEETEVERESLATRILKDDLISFLPFIKNIGTEQGAQLTTNAISANPIDEHFEELVLNITVRGSYQAVTNTVALFEHMPYQSSLRALSLVRDTDDVWIATFDFKLTKFKNI